MNEDVKSENVRIHSRADELIACLEGEIAKRDARIVELKRYDEAVERAAFEAWHKDRYPAVKIRVQNLLGTYTNMQVECNFETWLACAESHSKRFGGALLDANARLNGPPVSEAKARGVVMDGSQLAGLLEQVRLNDDEAKPHGIGATYWNNAVIACQVAIRDALDAPVQQVSVPDEMRSLAQRLREYNQNPHHINPMSEAFHILVADAANALSAACVPKEIAAAITWSEHLLFECGALTSTRAPSVHVYNKTFAAVNEARAMLAAAPAAPAADAGIVDMYRHLQKVTPYRFKKIQDASITDGGDVMYFHKDRFDAALLADMAALAAGKDAAP